MTVPYFLDWVKGRESLWTCPSVPLQLWGRGEGLEGWSGSHVKVGASPLWTVQPLGAVRGSFPPHCICRARWPNATLCWQQRSAPPSLEKQFAGCPWATIRGHELPTCWAAMTTQVRQQLYLTAEPEPTWLQRMNPRQQKRIACGWLFTVRSRTGGLLSSRRTSALPPQRLESKKWHFLFHAAPTVWGFLSSLGWFRIGGCRDALYPWCFIQCRMQPRLGAVPRKQQQGPCRQQDRWKRAVFPFPPSHLLYSKPCTACK